MRTIRCGSHTSEATWGARSGGIYVGSGHGNLLTEHGLQAVDMTLECPVTVPATPEGRFYRGKWMAQGREMDLLFHRTGDEGVSATCTLKTVLHDDVYVLESAGIAEGCVARALQGDAGYERSCDGCVARGSRAGILGCGAFRREPR